MIRRPNRRRGSALAVTLVIVILVAGFSAALASISFTQNRTSEVANKRVALSYAAEASLEKAVLFVNTSDYDFAGNQWLNGNSPENTVVPPRRADPRFPSGGDTPVFVDLIGDPAVPDAAENTKIRVEVFTYALDDKRQKFRLMARATRMTEMLILAQDVSAWDTFARFATFADQDTLSFGETTVKGHVHSNKSIVFYYGGANFSQEVTASEGFYYADGANSSNTHLGAPNPHATPIRMPSIGDLNAMRGSAEAMLNVSGENFHYGNPGDVIDADVEFLNDQVKIKATNRTTGLVMTGTYLLPEEGIIFVQGNVTSVKGTLSKRATLATLGDIRITDNLTYVDSHGTPQYQLTRNGSPVAGNATDPGTAWTAANGYDYAANPAFSPDAQRPSLGLMAANRITIADEAPRNVEVHSSLFSLNETWSAEMGTAKENLRIVGSIASKKAGARAQGGQGYALSGGYIYEDDLRQNPPPGWLKVQKPFWGPRWKTT